MGNNEDVKSSKSDKSSSPAPPDQGNIRVYPDWAAMQAYYGPRVAIPPYYNSTVASGHPPHPYMWGPPQVFFRALRKSDKEPPFFFSSPSYLGMNLVYWGWG
ncbi:hypothetical protein Patl1_00550 [Pistacia atlantica]|uniref:Uncharacterized protein n=1 Tax=Pistacia atlantica TaxID=434234 RepID=A0ACC1CD25_9ROSI|nr:hypothetical protein Patl1_00550 [Pistacia atlantica]